jgi:putative cell wall-binding protein
LHTHDGVEEDITQYIDWDADPALICGTTDRFSDFQVAVFAGDRVAGSDRYATAAALALRLHPAGADVVYVATGEAHPDALVAGVVAAAADAPVLLVRRDRVPTATVDALAALDPERIVVVGGTSAVSTAVRAELARSAGLSAVESIAGADRYETAANAARRAGDGANTVYVATGASFPDALTAGAIAGRTGAAVVLTAPDRLPASAAESLRSLDPDRVVVVGETAAISSSVESAIVDLLPAAVVERVGGVDRYATAAALAAGHTGGTVVAATGTAFADALVGTTLAVAEAAPVLLVARDRVPAVIRDRMIAIDPEHLVVIGGHAAVGPQAELRLTRLLPESVPDRL